MLHMHFRVSAKREGFRCLPHGWVDLNIDACCPSPDPASHLPTRSRPSPNFLLMRVLFPRSSPQSPTFLSSSSHILCTVCPANCCCLLLCSCRMLTSSISSSGNSVPATLDLTCLRVSPPCDPAPAPVQRAARLLSCPPFPRRGYFQDFFQGIS